MVQVSGIFAAVKGMERQLQCPDINSVWNVAVQKSLCDSGFTGIFTIWITHFLTAACLFFMLMMVSHFYGIYSPVTVAVNDEEDPVVGVPDMDGEPPYHARAELENPLADVVTGGSYLGGEKEQQHQYQQHQQQYQHGEILQGDLSNHNHHDHNHSNHNAHATPYAEKQALSPHHGGADGYVL